MGRLAKTTVVAVAAFGALVPTAGATVTFGPATGYEAELPTALTQGDFNGDGLLDLATIGNGTNASVLLGNGDGSFRPPSHVAVTNPRGIAAARLDTDNLDDLAVARGGAAGALDVYISTGNGNFAGAVSRPAGDQPQDVTLGRINADNVTDAAVPTATTRTVSIFVGDASGTFAAGSTPTPPLPGGAVPRAVALGDFDADGDNDLAIAASTDVFVAYNNGSGTFGAPAPLNTDPTVAVTTVDLDRNGRADVVAVKADGTLAVVRATEGPQDTKSFAAALSQPAGGDATSVATADLDADGLADLAVSNNGGGATALIGKGDGTFDIAGPFSVDGNPKDVVIGDYNRDGNPDVAVASPSQNRVFVLISRAPDLSFEGLPLAFGDQAPGTSTTKTFRFRNNGPPRAHLGGVALSGASEFSIVSNNCNGASLGIGEACTVEVRFAPTALGARQAQLEITTANAGGPHRFVVTGNGADPAKPGSCANDKNGTAAADTLNGTEQGDNLSGFGGDDILNGLGGNDCLTGGPGNDRLNGGEGRDTLEGNSGNDVEDGGNGNDRLSGGAGRDKVSGGAGNDSMNGVSGNDTLSGGTGNDRLNGSTGNDKLNGGSGKNSYVGGPGNDTITAANGRVESIDCGSGRDSVRADRKDRVKRCERVRRTRR